MYVCARIDIYMYAYIYTHICIQVYVCNKHLFGRIDKYMDVYMYTYMTRIHEYMDVYIYTYMYTCICM